MQVTIAVLNYNYGRFIGRAIDSALHQDYPDLDLVVIDNGSTDNSLEIIGGYGDRVRLVRQAVNIGQGQGYNLGFEAARGEWIVWLDADDMLDPDAISTCIALAGPGTSKVQYPLRLVDADGRSLSSMVPFLRHQGDVVPIIRRFGHYAGPPGSGNLYRRSAIAPYFPVNPADWPICTDTVPFVTAPFHGDVVDSTRPLGSYRLHSKAPSSTPGYRGNFSASMGAEVRLNYGARDKTLVLLRDRSGIDVPGPFLTMPPHVRHRIISWRCERDSHPFPEDTASSLWHLMNDSVGACPGYNMLERATMRVWALGVLWLPDSFSRALIATDRSNPVWASMMRWSRRFRT